MSCLFQQLDEQSTPLSSGIIPVENTPPSTVPSLKVDRTNGASENAHGTRSILRNSTHSSRQLLSQSSASSAKDHVREKSNSKSKRFPTTNADDVRPKLDRTQGDSTASSGDDEGKQPTGSNVNNKDERTAGIANAKGVKNQRFLKKSRGSSQNGGEAIPNDDINAKDGNGQEVVEGNFQVDETEGAEMSSRLTGPQSDGNMRSGHSSGMSTKKTKANKSDDQHNGVSSRRNTSTRRKTRSEVTTESESRKFGGSLETVERRDRKEGQRGCDAKSSEHHPRRYALNDYVVNVKIYLLLLQDSMDGRGGAQGRGKRNEGMKLTFSAVLSSSCPPVSSFGCVTSYQGKLIVASHQHGISMLPNGQLQVSYLAVLFST